MEQAEALFLLQAAGEEHLLITGIILEEVARMAVRAETALHLITRAVVAQEVRLLSTYLMTRIFLSQAVAAEEAEVTQGVTAVLLMGVTAVPMVVVVVPILLVDASLAVAGEALAWTTLREHQGLMAAYTSAFIFKEVQL